MGLFDKGGLLDKGLGVIDQLVIDEDKKNELRYALYMKYADVMFTGPGSKITKYTLCFLVASVVWAILYTFLTGGNVDHVIAVAGACSGVIGLMTGGLVVGTSQKRKWNALSNGANPHNTKPLPTSKRGGPIGPDPISYEEEEDPDYEAPPVRRKRTKVGRP